MAISVTSRTVTDVAGEFQRLGVTVAEWARAHSFNPSLVYRVLRGRQKCVRGESRRIAIALGLKTGEIGTVEELDDRLKALTRQALAA